MRTTLWLLAVLFLMPRARAQQLVPYTDGTRWGYAEEEGRVAIAPQWASADWFRDGHAQVVMPGPRDKPRVYASIDRNGSYIISPERRWNGEWRGFGFTQLNCADSNGNRGLVDDFNRLLLPCRYQAANTFWDSGIRQRFMMVQRQGLWGVAACGGQEVIPTRYAGLYPVGGSGGPAMVIARPEGFPAETWQLLDSTGQSILPYAVRGASWLQRGTLHGWAIVRAADTVDGFVSYPDGKAVFGQKGRPLYITPGGFFLRYEGDTAAVCDLNGRCLLRTDTGQTIRMQGDSLALIKRGEWRNDSIIRNVRYYNGYTLAPLTAWLREAQPNSFIVNNSPGFGCYQSRMLGEHLRQNEMNRPKLWVKGKQVTSFKKDGAEWQITGRANPREGLIAMRSTSDGRSAVAVVDDSLHFAFRPLNGSDPIIHYNPKAGIILRNGFRYPGNKPMTLVLDTTRAVKDSIPGLGIEYSLLANGRVYLVGKEYDSVIKYNRYRDLQYDPKRLFTRNGALVAGLESYEILFPVSEEGSYIPNSPLLLAKDSTGRMGIINVHGKVLYPAVGFRHRTMTVFSPNCFFTSDVERQDGAVSDASGRSLTPGLVVEYIYGAQGGSSGCRMYNVSYRQGARSGNFYMRADGRCYTDGFEKRIVASDGR